MRISDYVNTIILKRGEFTIISQAWERQFAIFKNGNYAPTNCRWATRLEQANNRRPRSK